MNAHFTADEYLTAASGELQAEGARVLFGRNGGATPPEWLASWDELLVNDTPGAAAFTAFTRSDGGSARLQERVDALVGGLAELGAFRGAAIGLNLIVVCAQTPPGDLRRAAEHLVPRAFFPGVRPRSFLIDLAASTVTGARAPEIRRLLERALQPARFPSPGAGEIVARHRRRELLAGQFYELMRGRRPVATYCLIAVNVAIFLLMIGTSGANALSTVLHGGPVADTTVRTWGAESPSLIEHGEWWRLFSEMFLHASLTHIVFNMASLLAVGTLAERLYGSGRYLAIYLGAGLIGSIVSYSFAVAQGNLNVLGVGASGAIFGIAGALLTIRFQPSELIPAPLRYRVSSAMAPLVLISLVLAAVTPYVDNSAHVGGLIGGMILSFVFRLPETAPARQ